MDGDRIFSRLFIWSGLAVAFSGFSVLGYQIFLFLRDGEWISYRLLYLAKYLPDGVLRWANTPDSWFGPHRIIENIPLSAGLAFVGMFITFAAVLAWARD
jgi:hypothetical protein